MFKYERHTPENTLLYQIIEKYYPIYIEQMGEQGRVLPAYVQEEFEAYLKCGVLSNGFLRVSCQDCHRERLVAFSCKRRGFCPSCGAKRMIESSAHLIDNVLPNQPTRQWVLSFPYQLRFLLASNSAIMTKVLQIVYRAIATYIIKKAGFSKKRAHTGAVTFIQRFGSALNLNIHFHMLFLDGVYIDSIGKNGNLLFVPIKTISPKDVTQLTHKISLRIARYLERKGFISRDAENCYLNDDMFASDELLETLGSSINYRIAIGPQKGKKVFTLKTLPPDTTDTKEALGGVGGFSLHANVSIKANHRDQLERLCRYTSRPALSEERILLTEEGNIIYELKKPYRDGTTHVIYEPLDFISKLAALIPMPRINLTRFHGLFASHHKYRTKIIPKKVDDHTGEDNFTQNERSTSAKMNWAQRLKRAFNIEIEVCGYCGGAVKVIACVEDPVAINKILTHIKYPHNTSNKVPLPISRAPPISLFSDVENF